MAEVLGPLGSATSLLSLIFSTIPTIMKARQNYLECIDHLRRYRIRVSSCDARTESLSERCRIFKVSNTEEQTWILEDIEQLREKMRVELQWYGITDSELTTWRKQKLLPRRIRDRLERSPTQCFKSALYALYQRNVIEDWVASMEKVVDSLERLLQVELEKQTAGHFKILDQDTVSEVEDVKQFFGSVSAMATTVYKGTVASKATGTVHDWALGLRSPDQVHDVSNWKFSQFDLELSFSMSRSLSGQIYWMHLRHDELEHQEALGRRQVEQAILSQVDQGTTTEIPGVRFSPKTTEARRTRDLGVLFKEKPDIFQDPAWRPDRAKLIHGLLNWIILLWDTRWFQNMCCHGLRVEVELQPELNTQTLSAKSCSVDDCGKSDIRLRNLGLVLAEIVIASPLRCLSEAEGDKKMQCQQFKGGAWGNADPLAIAREVRNRTKSIQFAQAISFCLTDMSRLATSEFQPGYTFRCIEKIYKP